MDNRRITDTWEYRLMSWFEKSFIVIVWLAVGFLAASILSQIWMKWR
jgi:hypothetical protein